eukprot:768264-Hanusia_phi.AAC.4
MSDGWRGEEEEEEIEQQEGNGDMMRCDDKIGGDKGGSKRVWGKERVREGKGGQDRAGQVRGEGRGGAYS